jgi:hypothetical protein
MAIDASIALGVKPVQIESPLNQMANVYALQNAAQSNQLNKIKMDEYTRGLAEDEQVKNYFATHKVSDPDFNAGLMAISPTKGIAHQKSMAEINEKTLQQKKLTGEITSSDYKQKQLEHDTTIKDVANATSAADAIATLNRYATEGKMKPEEVASLKAGISADPTKWPDIQHSLLLDLTDAKTQLELTKPNMVERTDGAKKWLEDTNRNSRTFGQRTPVTKMQATPGEIMTRDTQIRGQNLTDARELKRIEIEQGKNSPEYIAMEAKMKEQGKGQAKFEAAAPQAIATAEQMLTKIDQMVGTQAKLDKKGQVVEKGTATHPGFKGAVGTSSMYPLIPGTDAADFQARLDEIKGGAFLEAYNTLRGGGSITETEGNKATAARTRMSTAQTEKEFIDAARDYQDIIRTGIKDAKEKLAKGSKTLPTTTPAGATVSNWHD